MVIYSIGFIYIALPSFILDLAYNTFIYTTTSVFLILDEKIAQKLETFVL